MGRPGKELSGSGEVLSTSPERGNPFVLLLVGIGRTRN